jgi:predicted nuclease of predicted toxin-antitoxin system
MQRKQPLIWTDTHISPAIAKWLNEQFDVDAVSFYRLNFHTTSDYEIFMKAKEQQVIFITKDKDFKKLLERFKAPPFIIFLMGGNTSNAELKILLQRSLQKSIDLIIKHNHQIIEIE